MYIRLHNVGKNVFITTMHSSNISDYEKELDVMSDFYKTLKDHDIPCNAIYDNYFKKVHHIVTSNVYFVKIHELAIESNIKIRKLAIKK